MLSTDSSVMAGDVIVFKQLLGVGSVNMMAAGVSE
jgi:hypothetical protein